MSCKKIISVILACLAFAHPVKAVVDPLGVPNNLIGVHILDTSEITQAAKLVNSTGGDWGYVTVVIRSNDLDLQKWSQFFMECRKLHLIPIVRLATYPDGGTWVKPDANDLVDFANFLADMPWPTKNRYVILFNEVNRANEWGNTVSPSEYTQVLAESAAELRKRSSDFFLISAGLDMAVPNSSTSIEALSFYRQMGDWLQYVDGIGVHAYSNPGFNSPLTTKNKMGIVGYRFIPGSNTKPLFITETGWPETSPFYKTVFNAFWSDSNLVAVTPFLLHAANGDFAKFSLTTSSLQPKETYREIESLPKTAGSPLLSDVLSLPTAVLTTTNGANLSGQMTIVSIWSKLSNFWSALRGLTTITIGQKTLTVEVADTDAKRTQGLSGRSKLDENSGMWFKFATPGRHSFWMQGMRFPLDFIWIRGGRVVELDKNVEAPANILTLPKTITPHEKIDQVLEVNAGWADKYGIKEGDILTHEQN